MQPDGSKVGEQPSRERARDQPAVGLVATVDNGPTVAAALLQLVGSDLDPLVLPLTPDATGMEYARQLDVAVVDPGERVRGLPEAWELLTGVARAAGLRNCYKIQ